MASRTNYKRFCFFILCIIVLVAVCLLVDRKWVRAAMIIASPDRSDPKPGSVTGSPDRTYPKPFNTTGSADRTYPMPAAKPDSSDGSDPNPRTPPKVPANVHLDPIKKVNGPNRLNPNPGDAPERLPLHRNLYSQEAWPAVQYPRDLLPGRMPSTVYYMWCGDKKFKFQHYLGLLSAIRLLHPLKIIFYYTNPPVLDEKWYYTWFQELKQSFPNLELRKVQTAHQCGSRQLLAANVALLERRGGIYLGENVILTRFPAQALRNRFWYAVSESESTQGIIVAGQGFDGPMKDRYQRAVWWANGGCGTIDSYNLQGVAGTVGPPCLLVTEDVFPKDVWATETAFAELARWLFYGKREVAWGPMMYCNLHQGDWGFHLTNGKKKKKLADFLLHKRVHVLNKYGGVYQDIDTIWASPLPDWLLHYPTVTCVDWPKNGDWPAVFNTGVLLSQANAPWLQHLLSTFRYFRDHDHGFNVIFKPYNVYEMHPDTLYVDKHLQAICFKGICHPAWHADYLRSIHDSRPIDFDWHDVRAFHFTMPKPPPELQSPAALRASLKKDNPSMIAQVGRHILTQAGRVSLLEG